MIRFFTLALLVFCCTATGAQPPLTWAKHFDVQGPFVETSRALDIEVDASGNVYSVGFFQDTMDADPGPGVYILEDGPTSGQTGYVSKLDASGNFVWAAVVASLQHSTANEVELDALGNVYVTGTFNGNTDFDPGPGSFILPANSIDIFVWKLDTNGNLIWAGAVGGSGFEEVYTMDFDESGNILVAGRFAGTADLDPSLSNYSMTAAIARDAFILKLNTNGNFVWAKQLRTNNLVVPYDIVSDGSGIVYLSGSFEGQTDFDPDTSNYFGSAASSDGYILKLDSSGNFQWVKIFGGSSYDIYSEVELTPGANVVLFGYFDGVVDVDPGPGSVTFTSGFSGDPFFCSMDPAGNLIWARQLEEFNSTSNTISGMATDLFGNILLTGQFGNETDYDPGPGVVTFPTVSGYHAAICKYDSSGNYQWAGMPWSNMWIAGWAITSDVSGNVYVAGSFQDTVDYDLSSNMNVMVAVGHENASVCKYAGAADGIEESESASGVIVFPNPTSDKFVVQSSEPIQRICILDPTGRVVADYDYKGNRSVVWLSLEGISGLYYIQVTGTTGSVVTRAIVVQ